MNTWTQTVINNDDVVIVDHKIHRAARVFVAVTISDGNHRNNVQLLLNPEQLMDLALELQQAGYMVYEALEAERIKAEAVLLGEVES